MSEIINSIKQKSKRLAVLCLTMSLGASCALGWQSAPATSPAQTDRTARETRILLENCLRQNEELEYLTAKVSTLTKLDANSKDLVASLETVVAAQDKTITALKAANKASSGIEVISEKELKSLQDSLTAAQKIAAKWEARAHFWKRVSIFGGTTLTLIALVVGYTLGSK